jgi:hypothetical protein
MDLKRGNEYCIERSKEGRLIILHVKLTNALRSRYGNFKKCLQTRTRAFQHTTCTHDAGNKNR